MKLPIGLLSDSVSHKEVVMARKYVDCRDFPSVSKCTVAMSADNEKELLEIAVQHAVAVHGAKDTPEFRQELKGAIKEGSPRP
jgi:predicted small metal-binding protein